MGRWVDAIPRADKAQPILWVDELTPYSAQIRCNQFYGNEVVITWINELTPKFGRADKIVDIAR